ncbi:Crp/Fnr family transcriptional regulator [Bosea sp. TAF32]|uniref:Crp/Fnr family transcriptional regulator n=1 Tax=Bosea sp. TAF32 TaxID=3237482 RepID=UPI003F8F7612
MTPLLQDPMQALVRRLNAISNLTHEEQQIILALPAMPRHLRAGFDVASEGEKPDRCALVVSGWLCRYKFTGAGRKQILSFHIPGDIPDLQSLLLRTMDHNLAAITDARIVYLQHDSLRETCFSQPKIAQALWRDTLIDAATYREWMLGMGRRPALQHMAHFLCEIFVRQNAIGATFDGRCDLPISQAEMADAFGMSLVHLNRTLREMRKTGLVDWSHGRLAVYDFKGLQKLSGFDPTYLHLAAGGQKAKMAPLARTNGAK